MTTTLAQIGAKLDAAWVATEEVAEADLQIIGQKFEAVFAAAKPSILASLLTIIEDAALDFITNPATAFTVLAGQAATVIGAEWNAIEPQVQNGLMQTAAGLSTVPAAPTSAVAS